jgi:ferrous iron transport protein B
LRIGLSVDSSEITVDTMTAIASNRLGSTPASTEPGWTLVGAPNVGKSALFGRLTGAYSAVSNYPGTSVEVAAGTCERAGRTVAVLDTPGMYGLLAVTDEERVARRAVVEGADRTVVQVVDASHLDRALPLTLQLIALGHPMVVACNLMDEARRRGVAPDLTLLGERLGVPVVGTVATTGEGVGALAAAAERAGVPGDGWALPQPFAEVVARAAEGGREGTRLLDAELALCGDPECEAAVSAAGPAAWEEAVSLRDARWGSAEGFAVALATARRRMVLALLDGVVPAAPAGRRRDAGVDRFLLSPWTGLPLVLLVLYVGFYGFVGRFGAGTLVGWVESVAFDGWITPRAAQLVHAVVPWAPLADLLVGPYGIVPLALRYAVAIVLPIVGSFFLVFALLEDCGYLPRLALLLDRGLKRLGLSGRAVIPLVLGFGCNTMATLVTRTLETRRERLIVTLLLALAIPCSAQLGVVLGILSVHPGAVAVWAGVLLGVFAAVGALAARLLPGEPPSFYLELPPLRLPTVRNVLLKTSTRVRWYFAEILPLFLLASVLLWLGDLTGALRAATHLLEPLVRAIALPDAAAPAFLYGFFRRDFGAAGLYDLARSGALGPAALTTAAVTITLFVPCVAQFLVMRRERGLRTALAVLATATTVAFAVGGAVGWVLRAVVGWA